MRLSRYTIYVVDDEHVIADTLAVILEREGFRSSAFYSAEDALRAIERQAPDLVISDIVMPAMTGIELLLHLQRRHVGLQCLLLSGNAATSGLLAEARDEGHFLTALMKPIHPSVLLQHIHAMLQN